MCCDISGSAQHRNIPQYYKDAVDKFQARIPCFTARKIKNTDFLDLSYSQTEKQVKFSLS